MRIRILFFIALALVLAQASFGGTVSNCVNWATPPITTGSGTLLTQFTCSLYNNGSSTFLDLTPFETEGGAPLASNAVGAGFLVVINGDPSLLPDDNTGLFNQSLWRDVLYFVGDQEAGYTSDNLWVYWNAALFPSAAIVQTYDQNRYGASNDAQFFVQYNPAGATTFTPDANHEYDIYGTPEPGSMVLLGSSLALLSGVFLRRRRTAGRSA
jgi:hypothetical protein